MKYQQTREQSVDLFKQAVRLMAQQDAGFHPVSYTVWYEHVSGINPPLSTALTARLTTGPLSEAETVALNDTHIRDQRTMSLARALGELMLKIVETARSAGADLTQFRVSLEDRNAQLSEPLEQMAIRAVVAGLIGDTQKMHTLTGELSGTLAADIDQVASLQKRLKEAEDAAFIDPLTGLLNRRGFDREVRALMVEAGSLKGCVLLFFDVDHFKRLNDSYGHLLGDKVLKAIANIFKANLKGKDITARLGGEEFAVLLSGTSVQGASKVADHIRKSISQGRIRQQDGQSFGGVTVSVGVCEAQGDDTLMTLLDRTDKAMYAAKEQGRDRVHVSAEIAQQPAEES
jgi:diguanylate cyclase